MKKLSVFAIAAFTMAVGSAFITKANPKLITYNSKNLATPPQCVTETNCIHNSGTQCSYLTYVNDASCSSSGSFLYRQ